MEKLQRLDNEFDLANSTGAEFHIALDIFVADYVPFDPSLDAADLFEDVARRALGKNERLMLPQKFVNQLAAAGDPARFDEGEPLPGLAEAGVIIFHAVDRACEGAGCAFRSESQIDSKQSAGRIVGGESLDDFCTKLIEPLVIGEIRRDLTLFAVNENHVDVRAVIQLAAAHF